MPVSFINWPTTDPLSHPYEPLADEDRVAIDANHVRPEPAWDGGYFASYHAYPYYPDFQRFEPALLEYESQGRFDPYAGYLAMMREHHAGLPVVVAEYGVPGGMGQAHRGPLGRDQGAHAEQDQMILNAEMMEVIRTEELAGGLVFEWADEWFKPTWNTVDLEQPADRRGLWSNAYNAESHYGLVAIEPGLGNHVVVDGLLGDWEAVDATTILTGDGAVRQVLGTHDAAYLYLGLRLASESIAEIAIGFDVLDGESGGLPDTDGLYPESDYAWVLGPGLQAQALVRASNDPFGVRYGLLAGYFPAESADFVDGSRAWNEIRLLTSNPLVVPVTGAEIPAESFGVGQLVHGSTDPNDAAFDSRATWYRTGDTVELRVPYASIGISDPSSLQALRVHSDGAVTFETFDSVGISVVAEGREHRTAGYGWARWDRVDWRQRLKAGADLVGAAMSDTSAP